MGSTLLKRQPHLFPVAAARDNVFTPRWLSQMIIARFNPSPLCLDPCRGEGAFYDYLPAGSEWCEIREGRDFFAWSKPVNWIIGNPPYSDLLAWIRHSFKVADNIVYLLPLHRVMASYTWLTDVRRYGGLVEVLVIGTGTTAGFPFGHALTAVYYKRNYTGGTAWTYADATGRLVGIPIQRGGICHPYLKDYKYDTHNSNS
jgi:hypothetical protein